MKIYLLYIPMICISLVACNQNERGKAQETLVSADNQEIPVSADNQEIPTATRSEDKSLHDAIFIETEFPIAVGTIVKKNFWGHDARKIYSSLSKLIPPKTEYETRAEYNQRAMSALNKPLLGNLTGQSKFVYGFNSIPNKDISYDAETDILSFYVQPFDNCERLDVPNDSNVLMWNFELENKLCSVKGHPTKLSEIESNQLELVSFSTNEKFDVTGEKFDTLHIFNEQGSLYQISAKIKMDSNTAQRLKGSGKNSNLRVFITYTILDLQWNFDPKVETLTVPHPNGDGGTMEIPDPLILETFHTPPKPLNMLNAETALYALPLIPIKVTSIWIVDETTGKVVY